MKHRFLLASWLVIPALLVAFHYGPGERELARDRTSAQLRAARDAESREQWSEAFDIFGRALSTLPSSDTETRLAIELARCKARIARHELPEASADLQALLNTAEANSVSTSLKDAIRSQLASTQYYVGWLMRLEGAPADEWTRETEQARQHFRVLAETQRARGEQGSAEDHEKNLESVVRLARMDLSELQGLPLPKQCNGCKNCSQKTRKQRTSQSQKPGEPPPKDARQAGEGTRPDDAGS